MKGHLGHCARSAKDCEVDVTSVRNFKNGLYDVPT